VHAQGDGRVALLDWGQVKALSSKERTVLCELYCSLGKRDVRGALNAAVFFRLQIGQAEELAHLTLTQKAEQVLKMFTIMFDTR
jgi:predicted unusual protein kinase regulating ubiquinone biosynthesis (AarF/ABC1/UbiB family)